MNNVLNTNKHIPVMLAEVIHFLQLSENKKEKISIFDGTLGGGGYSNAFLEKEANIWACDLDAAALDRSAQRFLQNGISPKNFTLTHANFASYIATFEDNFFDGIVLDLGYSSNQLEVEEKGFSYLKKDQILDLRFNSKEGKPAWQKIFELKDDANLRDVFYRYSGEQLSAKLARTVLDYLRKRGTNEPLTVGEFSDILVSAIPAKLSKKTSGILSRIWQSLRIWTNNEFASLEKFLLIAVKKLKPGGRLVIVSFHSLEDKIVTQFMRDVAKPIQTDEFGNTKKLFELITKKVSTPTIEEIDQNPRSRSALLRCVEKM